MAFIHTGLTAWRRWAGQALDDRDRIRDRREALLLSVVASFVFVNAFAFSLAREAAISWLHFYAPLVWLAVVGIAHFLLRTMRPCRDPFLLPIFALLTGWGLLLQDRLAPNFLDRQTLWFTLSTAVLLIVAIAPRTLQPLMRYRYVLLVGGLILLAVTLIFGVNPSGSGAALWLPVPFPFVGQAYFQPSELLKLLLVIFLASYFTEQEPLYRYRQRAGRRDNGRSSSTARHFVRQLPFLGPLLLMWGFTLLLLVWQRDLGAAALFFLVFVVMLYLATGERTYVWSGLALLLVAGAIAFYAFDAVVASRVLSWLNPWPHASDRAYQIVQALYAQAAGGVLGQGIGQGFPDYIPVVHSDFALAAVAEEWGLVGSLTIIASFGVLAVRGLRAALLAIRGERPRVFYAYLAAGLVTLFTVQSLLIMGGISRLLPLTGITLPFVSYGGSSLLISSTAVGMLLFLSAETAKAPAAGIYDPGLARRLNRLAALILGLFGLVALTFIFWSVVRAGPLLAREDNPRLVEAERRVQRGRILDRDGVILAESTGPADNLIRRYPQADVGPAVGYYSARFGAAGIESAFDALLRGQTGAFWPAWVQNMLHLPPAGGDVRLTIDADLQGKAAELMDGHVGGLALLELTEIGGEQVADIRAMVSQPGYDANQISEEFETLTATDHGPLFNRATQALYQPGLLLQPLIVAAAVDDGLIALDDPVADPHRPIAIDGQVLRCVTPRGEDNATYTWAEMAAMRCPGPLHALGDQLGATVLDEIFARFGLKSAPDLPIPTEANVVGVIEPSLAAIGQENLTVTPLQAAMAAAVIAGDGRLPTPRLVEAVAPRGDDWEIQPAGASGVVSPVIAEEVAEAVRATWPVVDNVSVFTVSVLSGPDGSRDTWAIGLAPAGAPRYVAAILLEGVESVATGEAISRALLANASGP
jgi:cell division protein FtsW (lipid II flippase)/cell division protein FtsI/penicillin-binding protein 2